MNLSFCVKKFIYGPFCLVFRPGVPRVGAGFVRLGPDGIGRTREVPLTRLFSHARSLRMQIPLRSLGADTALMCR